MVIYIHFLAAVPGCDNPAIDHGSTSLLPPPPTIPRVGELDLESGRDRTKYGDSLQVSCNTGYYVDGPSVITCQSSGNGTWTQVPACKRKWAMDHACFSMECVNMPYNNYRACVHVCMCVFTFVGSCLATKVFIGNLPATGREWVIMKLANDERRSTTNKQVTWHSLWPCISCTPINYCVCVIGVGTMGAPGAGAPYVFW